MLQTTFVREHQQASRFLVHSTYFLFSRFDIPIRTALDFGSQATNVALFQPKILQFKSLYCRQNLSFVSHLFVVIFLKVLQTIVLLKEELRSKRALHTSPCFPRNHY